MTSASHEVRNAHDPLLETSWMMPLLAMRGGTDDEFQSHVSSMLARVGAGKVAYMYEQQVLDLGGPGAIPLIAFLRSPTPEATAQQRLTAARIIRETAPHESIPDLIALLGDDEPDVRIAAAAALERLTGLTQGVAPDEWRTLDDRHVRAREQWRTWLERTRGAA
jgi:hypothetical protein